MYHDSHGRRYHFGARTTGKREKVVLRRLRRLLSYCRHCRHAPLIRHLGIWQNPPLARDQSVDCRVRVRVKVFYHPGLIGVRAEEMVIFLVVKDRRPKYRTSVPNMKENSRQSKSIFKAKGAKTTKNLSTPIFFYGRSAIFLRIRSILFSTKNSTNH
jgi:hypothetical protein